MRRLIATAGVVAAAWLAVAMLTGLAYAQTTVAPPAPAELTVDPVIELPPAVEPPPAVLPEAPVPDPAIEPAGPPTPVEPPTAVEPETPQATPEPAAPAATPEAPTPPAAAEQPVEPPPAAEAEMPNPPAEEEGTEPDDKDGKGPQQREQAGNHAEPDPHAELEEEEPETVACGTVHVCETTITVVEHAGTPKLTTAVVTVKVCSADGTCESVSHSVVPGECSTKPGVTCISRTVSCTPLPDQSGAKCTVTITEDWPCHDPDPDDEYGVICQPIENRTTVTFGGKAPAKPQPSPGADPVQEDDNGSGSESGSGSEPEAGSGNGQQPQPSPGPQDGQNPPSSSGSQGDPAPQPSPGPEGTPAPGSTFTLPHGSTRDDHYKRGSKSGGHGRNGGRTNAKHGHEREGKAKRHRESGTDGRGKSRELPFTGLDLGGIAGSGLVLLLAGAFLRRRLRLA